MPNRLAAETSPYLRQHADNPVDWHGWGEEALGRARSEDKPILLSIGYAACHWCHVMAHESFEDEATARVMNANFVNIKVDREERPDLDAIYMRAVQVMTGHGGWPMTVFLTPEGEPFYGGTYFPPSDRHGMPAFPRVLLAVADTYANRRGDVRDMAIRLRAIYADRHEMETPGVALTPANLHRAFRAAASMFDPRYGGIAGAPKFPPTMLLDFFLRYWARTGTSSALEIVTGTMRRMARGGIYDQIGGGFARYSTDERWLVPHFEKMLYDNALLVRLGAHLVQATGDPEIRRVTEETVEWLRREMTSPGGGFYSSLDADSEGHEGKFYVWSVSELDEVLGDDAPLVKAYFGVTLEGNFEGANILSVVADPDAIARRFRISDAQVAEVINRTGKKLYERRARRIWPGRDEKILAGWNGLMLRGLCAAARALARPDWSELAVANGEFLAREMVRGGRVMRSHMEGVTRIPGFLEDHAAVALAFLDLHALTFDPRWLERATEIARATVDYFWDDETARFFDTATDHERLIVRPRDASDNAMPAGVSLAAELCLLAGELTGDASFTARAEKTLT